MALRTDTDYCLSFKNWVNKLLGDSFRQNIVITYMSFSIGTHFLVAPKSTDFKLNKINK